MPTPTYDLIASSVLASSASSVTFSSISQDYRDLVLVTNGIATTAETRIEWVRVNGSSGLYPKVDMIGTGSTTSSFAASNTDRIGTIYFDENGGLGIYQFFDYSVTDKHKSVLVRGNLADYEVYAGAHRWADTAAITSIEIFSNDAYYAAGSTFSLYGIAG